MNDFPESDWQMLSRLKPLALDRLCQRIVQGAGGIISSEKGGRYHSTYLELFEYFQKSDKSLSHGFDDWRRSQAFFILASWRMQKLITDDEFSAFSAQTRKALESLSR